ncbi:hypothetical protein F0562_002502 [Nyssa sinensis]|uniref:BEACH-type PH domain-containing protein n=1 Tax=Nyssa sinensis TaxID=561372 RepID=A0A5J5C666_9ASTE|nr:hypothetical protein F0562_002502 [Nyssa sinensis]
MFQKSSGKTMKWVTLLKDFKEKVGLAQASSTTSSSSSSSDNNVSSTKQDFIATSPSRDNHELELDFKRYWEEFHSSSSEKEKETAFNLTVDVFCRLAKQHANVAQLITMLVETHIFSFVVGRAFVTDIEKLKIRSKTRSLDVGRVLSFFSEVTKDGIRPGSNLLNAVELLISGPIDKQSLLDSGILSCLIHILNALLDTDEGNHRQKATTSVEPLLTERNYDGDVGQLRRLEVEGSVIHIMKAFASHPSAAQSLIEDNSLLLLFQMVTNGSLIVFSQYREGLVPLHTIQLHRHAMQILGLLLANDNGSTAKYIQKHQLIKVLLMAVKDFNPDYGDDAYTMGIVDLLLECVELSYRPEAGGTRLREDVHNAHGYQFLVQFALILSKNQSVQAAYSKSSDENSATEGSHTLYDVGRVDLKEKGVETSPQDLSPALSRLLDVLVNLAQTGPADTTGSAGLKGSKNSHKKPSGHGISCMPSSDWLADEIWVKGNNKVKDLEAVQMLQDIFLKADSRELQAEVLNRMFKIFSSHLENYKLCQQLRTVPLLILNMAGFPPSLQEIILKILEYAVTVVNCIPDQELLSLCCLLQQPITSELKHTILSFFVKLLSFDQQYKKVLREVGVLEVLLDDLKQHKFLLGPDQHNSESNQLERKSSSSSFKKHLDSKDAIISSPKLLESGSGKCPLFGVEGTIVVAWDCLVSLLKKEEANQMAFRSANGVTVVLPFLVSDIHRLGVLQVLSCLIIEDVAQAHSEELCALVDVLKSGMVTSVLGSQYRLQNDAKCDTFGALWHILRVNNSAQRLGQVVQLLLELALEIVVPPFLTSETAASSNIIENGSEGFVLIAPSGSFIPYKGRFYNAGAVRVLVRSLLLFTPKVQIELLNLIEQLARVCPFNRENLTSVGCVELLLETVYPFLLGSSPLLSHALKIVEVLGTHRLSASELRVLIRYILQMRQMNSGHLLVDMMKKLILMEGTASENVSLAPFVEMDMSTIGHGSIQVSLGERSWPPAAGYSFVCWFQYQSFFQSQIKEIEASKAGPSKMQNTSSGQHHGAHLLRIFSVGAADNENTFYLELYLQEDGVLTLATSNSCSLSFFGLELEEGRWHHLAVVHSKPNALAGLFQASIAYVYLNGKLRHTGKLGYSPSPVGKSLQVTIGTPVTCARVRNLSWKLRSCHLFEEVLTSGSICFMYILGRGYMGLFQDTDLLRFLPNQACGGGSMAILDSLDTDLSLASNMQRPESVSKLGSSKADCSGIVWDLERLGNLSLPLSGKKLIFAFDGTCSEAFRASGTLSMLNLVDPMSAAASPIGGIPHFGRLQGDVYVCRQCAIGDTIRLVGGMAVVLALVEAAETRDMLHMALMLLAYALRQNPQNVRDMQTYRGYHLLALFLRRRMSLFDMQSLDIFFQIAACQASFSEPKKSENNRSTLSPAGTIQAASYVDLSLSKFHNEFSSVGSHGDMDDFSAQKDSFSHISELENADIPAETSNCIVLSNADMVEHVLLDWTLWVTAPISIQIALLGFLEHLVSMHWYRNHNLTILRQKNLVQRLLVTLQRGDVEVPILEKLVVLLGVILEDGFLASELEHVVRFVIMTFDPPELTSRHQIMRESMGKHVIVRNMLLEMLIDLQVIINSEELLEQWHKIVSSKLITYFLDEAVHPTSMRWVMTLLGVCLASSPTFTLKFRTSGGYQGLARVLPSFYDSPDIYYILFCLIFGKPVYPRLPEVRMLDFHALMPNDGNYGELKFVELLESVIAMAKSTFDRLCMQSMLAHKIGNLSQVGAGVVAELVRGNQDMAGELQGEALMHKTYAARLMGGEASAPAAATSVLRFMVDLAKMCPPFSAVCRRVEFLESCVDLYFSCVSAACAVKMAKELSVKTEDKNLNDCDDTSSSQNTFSSLLHEQEPSVKTSINVGSFHHGQESNKPMQKDLQGCPEIQRTPSSSPFIALASWLGGVSQNKSKKAQSAASLSMKYSVSPSMKSSVSLSEFDPSSDLKSTSQGPYAAGTSLAVNPELLLEMDNSGPAGVLKTLEFLLSMLQLANKDGRIEEAAPTGKRLLSMGRGSRQLDAYIHAILKNTNRMVLYCFLPSFLITIGEVDLLSCLGLQIELKKRPSPYSSQEDTGLDICTVLRLLVAHRQIIFCPRNLDTDLNCCLCINLTSLLHDQRRNAQNLAVDILKYLLVHRRAVLEDLLVSKPNQKPHLDVLHGGFDKLLTGSFSAFSEWFQSSEQVVNKVLEQCAAITWVQYIAGTAKFPGVRIKGMDGRRKREMGKRSRDTSKLELKHWEQDKYGWVLHAESEWQAHLQQLVHERGIFPMGKSSFNEDPEWQLCPIEGPYRMRKKLERCKLKVDTIENVLNGLFELGEVELSKEKSESDLNVSDAESDLFCNLLTDTAKQDSFESELYNESIFKASDNVRDVASNRASAVSVTETLSIQGRSDLGSPRQSSFMQVDEVKVTQEKSDKELNDNGEYLIRPYLEPLEKIKFRYNCERVVGLDKHDGIFLIGELSLYIIENFYIDDSGCVCEKECEDELSVIDQALGVKKDFSCSMDSHSKSTSSWSVTVKSGVGGRAWAYNGGAWGKEKLRPVAVEIFSMDGCNDLLVFHKKEREEVFKNLVAMNLPRNSMLDTTISGSTKTRKQRRQPSF